MPEPLVECLSRFTPSAEGLNRDALLFAAGQASVRRTGRTWAVLVGALAASQLLTLALLWPASKSLPAPVAESSAPRMPMPTEAPPEALEPTALAALTRSVVLSGSGDLPTERAVQRLVNPGPPLRASMPSSLKDFD